MFSKGWNVFGASAAVRRQDFGIGSGASLAMSEATGGLVAGTQVASAMGWRAAEAIATGDLVLTFDRGLQPVKAVHRAITWAAPVPRSQWPLMVPAGVLGNAAPMLLQPDQQVMLESDAAEAVFGDPFTLITASDLEGFRGIGRVAPEGPTQTIVLEFQHDEVIFAQHGALAYCGRPGVISLDELMSDNRADMYRSVDSETARDLLDCILHEEAPVEGGVPGQYSQPVYAAAA